MVLLAISKFGQIDQNLHNHVFDDVICKPPVRGCAALQGLLLSPNSGTGYSF